MALKDEAASFWKKIPHKGFVVASVAVGVVLAILIIIFKSYLPPVVPLFYGRPEGAEQLVSTLDLLLAPVFIILIVSLNLFVSKFVNDNFIKTILVASSFLISVLVSITIIKIIFLVGFF